jgi:DNA-binding NarL/FixJ family response regulator
VAPRAVTIAAVEGAGAVWVEVLTTQQIVGLGFRHALEIAPGPLTITTSGPPDAEPDVVLYDVIKLHEGDGADLDFWVKIPASIVIAIDRTLRPELGAQARSHGVEWSINLGISDADFVQVIREAIAGTLEASDIAQEWDHSDYLCQDHALSRREADIVRLVVAGHSNQEIASELYLSVNSVKTYIRSAYRKAGVSTRAQAVAWAIEHGFSRSLTHGVE